MSSNIVHGFFNEKPISRVTHPPGGKSNNIFGDPATANGHHKNDNSSSSDGEFRARPHHKENTQNNLFGEPPPAQRPRNPDRQKSNIFDPPPAVVAPSSSNNNKFKRGTYNPITGKSYEQEEAERAKQYNKQQDGKRSDGDGDGNNTNNNSSSNNGGGGINDMKDLTAAVPATNGNLHTSCRVSQPPGGRSSKLW